MAWSLDHLFASLFCAHRSLVAAQAAAAQSIEYRTSSSLRALQQQQQQQPTKQAAAQSQPKSSAGTPAKGSNSSQTCCSCKCVIPSKDARSPECKRTPGCVGMGAPSYSTKNICAAGANRKCEDVCIRNMGSWKALYEC